MMQAIIATAVDRADQNQHTRWVEDALIDRVERRPISTLANPPTRWPEWFHSVSDSFGDYGDDKVEFFV